MFLLVALMCQTSCSRASGVPLRLLPLRSEAQFRAARVLVLIAGARHLMIHLVRRSLAGREALGLNIHLLILQRLPLPGRVAAILVRVLRRCVPGLASPPLAAREQVKVESSQSSSLTISCGVLVCLDIGLGIIAGVVVLTIMPSPTALARASRPETIRTVLCPSLRGSLSSGKVVEKASAADEEPAVLPSLFGHSSFTFYRMLGGLVALASGCQCQVPT